MATTDIAISKPAVPAIVRRNTLLLALGQCVYWIGVQTIATLGGIVAFELTGDQRWAGIPVTLSILASAFAAVYAGRLTDRLGRKPVLIAGQVADGLGSAIGGFSILYGSFAGFLAGIILRGVGIGATALSRSAAADMYPPARRAQGLSMVVTGGAVGAIFGPLLLATFSGWARSAGLDTLAVPWLGMAAISAAGVASFWFIRPDPRQIASNLEEYYPGETVRQSVEDSAPRPVSVVLRQFPLIMAIVSISLVQAGMVMLMVTAALSMKLHGHGDDVYGVMTGHFFGMLGLSVVIGRLADRWGRRAVLMGGALLFIAGAVTAPIFQNPLYNGASLLLVGLGWSLCYVAGNAMLADTTRPLERGRITGTNDLLVGLTGASASLAGGLLLSGAGFLTVGAVGLALGLLPFLLALRLKETSPGRYRE